MNTLPSLCRLLPLLVFAGAPLAAQTPARESAATLATPAPVEGITIEFRGGSLAQLAAAINASGRGTFNIIGQAEDVNAAILPAFSVRNADPAALMESLNSLLRSRDLELNRPRKGNDWIEGTYTLNRRQPAARDNRPAFTSFQLGPYLAEQSIDDIVGAIRTAWELDPNHKADELKIKFHAPTNLLLVSGPNGAVGAVQALLEQLKRTASAPVSPAQEQARLKAVAGEVERRRAQRENAAARPGAPAPEPVPPPSSEKK